MASNSPTTRRRGWQWSRLLVLLQWSKRRAGSWRYRRLSKLVQGFKPIESKSSLQRGAGEGFSSERGKYTREEKQSRVDTSTVVVVERESSGSSWSCLVVMVEGNQSVRWSDVDEGGVEIQKRLGISNIELKNLTRRLTVSRHLKPSAIPGI